MPINWQIGKRTLRCLVLLISFVFGDYAIMSIYVGNLSYRVTEADINEVFAEYGTVKTVSLPTDRETGRVRGFAFVELTEDNQEDAAIAALDGAEWLGRELKVSKARPREERGGRSFGGGGGNRGGGGYGNRDSFSRGGRF
jgi:RNA recognition motif-containing protein